MNSNNPAELRVRYYFGLLIIFSLFIFFTGCVSNRESSLQGRRVYPGQPIYIFYETPQDIKYESVGSESIRGRSLDSRIDAVRKNATDRGFNVVVVGETYQQERTVEKEIKKEWGGSYTSVSTVIDTYQKFSYLFVDPVYADELERRADGQIYAKEASFTETDGFKAIMYGAIFGIGLVPVLIFL